MKTIEEGLNEAYKKAGDNAYFGNGFNKGVEFAQRWIPVSEELPEIRSYCLVKLLDNEIMFAQFNYVGVWIIFWFAGVSNKDIDRPITHWRPIELK